MTFENVAAVFRKSGSADRSTWRTYVCTSINGRAIKTGGYASMPNENRHEAKCANLYPPLCPPCLCFSPAKLTQIASARANYSSLQVGITFHNVCTLYVFNLSTRKADMFFFRKRINM